MTTADLQYTSRRIAEQAERKIAAQNIAWHGTSCARAAYWLNAAAESRRFAARCWGDARRFELARAANYVQTARAVVRGTGNFYARAAFAEVTR